MKRPLLAAALLLAAAPAPAVEPPVEGVVRVATYNVSMYRDRAGQLLEEVETGDSLQAKQVAEVLQRVRPDVVLLNEFDYAAGEPSLVTTFQEKYLRRPQAGLPPIDLPHFYYQPVNTGVDSGLDLDKDGQRHGPADAWGYGRYPGQYGMLLLSRFEIDEKQSFSFRGLRWKDYPGAQLPTNPATGEPYYSEEELEDFPLASKSFWDVAVRVPAALGGGRLHLLCSHPTPPVFDGPEDRNGKRNYDEIGLIAKYLSSARSGSRLFIPDNNYSNPPRTYPTDEPFVVLGDLNADPVDGGGRPGAIQQLLDHPAIDSSFIPTSEGGVAAAKRAPELSGNQKGDPAHHTGNFNRDGHANLRVDYALPSKGLKVVGGGVFWPSPGEPGAEAIAASDHRLVWIDIQVSADEQLNEPAGE